MAPRVRSIDVTARTPEGKPLRGTSIHPDLMDHMWEIDSSARGGLRFKRFGRSESQEKPELASAVMREINRSEANRKHAEKRKAEQMKNWPLYGMPSPRQVVRYGPKRQAYTLPPEEYAMAMDLREATRGGDDFKGMMASIEAAGFLIRPMISKKKHEEGYTLIGFRFARDGIVMMGSMARISITESTEIARAPILARDGAMLMEMRDAYDEIMTPITDEISKLRTEIEEIIEAAGSPKMAAGLLMDAGVVASKKQDMLNDNGGSYRRSRYEMSRDDVTLKIVSPWDPQLVMVARRMVTLATELEASEDISPSP